MNIAAHIFGFIALLSYCLSIRHSDKKILLKYLMVTNLFYSLQYLMLNSYSALFVSFIAVIRSLIFIQYEKNNKRPSLFSLFVVFGLLIYSFILSYNGFLSIIPISMGLLYTYSVWQENIKFFRIFVIVNATVWIIYNFIIGAYVGAFASVVELAYGIYVYTKFNIKKQSV